MAKKFLEQVMADEKLQEQLRGKEPDEVVSIAKEMGFDVTEEDLTAAVNELKEVRAKQGDLVLVSDDEVEQASGGAWWLGEDAPDGHEMGCGIFYHGYDWSKKNNIWCNQEYYCLENNYKGDVPVI